MSEQPSSPAGPIEAAEAALEVAARLLAPWATRSNAPEPGRLDVWVAPTNLTTAIGALRAARWGRLSAITGLDLKAPPAAEKPARPAPAAARAGAPAGAPAAARPTAPGGAASPARPARPGAAASPSSDTAGSAAPTPAPTAVPAAAARPAGTTASAPVKPPARPAGAASPAAQPAGAASPAARPAARPAAAAPAARPAAAAAPAPAEPPTDDLEALYHFCSFTSGAVLTLRIRVPRATAELPTICGVVPYAGFYERELSELFGITIVGAASHDPLILPDDWPAGVYPLRKDASLPKPPDPRAVRPEPPEPTAVRPEPPEAAVIRDASPAHET